MKRIIIFLILLGLITIPSADAGFGSALGFGKKRTRVQEEDGSPDGWPMILKVTNGSLTDNGDETFTLSTATAETDPLAIHKDGSVPLTADWDAGNSSYGITAVEFKGALTGNADTASHASDLSITSETAGDVIYFDGSNWVRLAGSGTDTWVLAYNTSTNVPYWKADADSGGSPATADISDVSVTQTELAELETIGATTISANQWVVLGGIAETLTFTELNLLDGITVLSGSNTGDNTVATSGDAAVDFFGAGVDAVTDTTTCTDIEGTDLSITDGVLNFNNSSGYITATLTQEEVDDYVNLLLKDADSVNTRITITYDDTDNAFDFVVDDMNDDTPEGADYDVVFTGNGLMTRTAASTYTSRTITGTANEITMTNGDGVAGNPTITIHADIARDAEIPTVSDIAYDATSWNTNTDAATKNSIRDRLEILNTAIDLNTAKNTNVSTDLSVGTVGINTVAITSDGGADDVTLPAATVTTAGMLTTAKWAEIVANNAKVTDDDVGVAEVYDATNWDADTGSPQKNDVRDKIETMVTAIGLNTAKNTNVSTTLEAGTVNATTYGITSDGGADDIVLPEADTTNAGLLGADKWDEIVANSLKTTESTTGGRSITLNGTAVDADAELYTTTKCILIETPADADDFLFFRTELASTVTSIDCICEDATSAIVVINECDSAGANCGSGSTRLQESLTCDVDGATDDGTLGNAGLAVGGWLRAQVGTVTGTPGHVTVCITTTKDD